MNIKLLFIIFTSVLVDVTLASGHVDIIDNVATQVEKEVAAAEEISKNSVDNTASKKLGYYSPFVRDLYKLYYRCTSFIQNIKGVQKYPQLQDSINDRILASVQDHDVSKDFLLSDIHVVQIENIDANQNGNIEPRAKANEDDIRYYSFINPDSCSIENFATNLNEPSELTKMSLLAYKVCENCKNSLYDKAQALYSGFSFIDKNPQNKEKDIKVIESTVVQKNDEKGQIVLLDQKIEKLNQDIHILYKKYSRLKVAFVVGLASCICYEVYNKYHKAS